MMKSITISYRIKAYSDQIHIEYSPTQPWRVDFPSSGTQIDVLPGIGFEVEFVESKIPTDKMLADTAGILFSNFPGLRNGYATNMEKGLTEFLAWFMDYKGPKVDTTNLIDKVLFDDSYKGIRKAIGTFLVYGVPGPNKGRDRAIKETATQLVKMFVDEILQQNGETLDNALVSSLRGVVIALLETFYESPADLVSLCYYIASTAFQCHWPEISLAWLMSKDSYYTDTEPVSIKYRFPEIWRAVMVNCPVDVIVYDENGNEFASVRGENVTNTSEAHGISITETGTKQIILPSDASYSIQITATDAGEMDYSMLEYNVRDRKYNLVQSYQNLPLTTGKSYHAGIPAFHTDDYYDEESDGSATKYTLRNPEDDELQPTTVLRGNEVYKATVTLSTNNNKGIVTGGGSFVATEYAQIQAVCMPTVEFLGWYRDSQLVSTEETYRFEVLEDIELVAYFSEGDYHTLCITSTEGGTVPEGSCDIPATVQIQIAAEASDGYEFVRWEATAGSFDNPQKINALFTMPSENVTVMAVFQSIKNTLPPKTGDDTPLGLYVALLSVSACALGVSMQKRKTKFVK